MFATIMAVSVYWQEFILVVYSSLQKQTPVTTAFCTGIADKMCFTTQKPSLSATSILTISYYYQSVDHKFVNLTYLWLCSSNGVNLLDFFCTN